ncbi:MAG TPA: universal stress protein [Methylomirabilota bacterium]|nr:universal stress protein [Methylomirabilota bacterium]
MPLKDLMVHVGTDPAGPTRVDVAVALAVAHGAHLTGLHVMTRPVLPGFVELELPASVHEAQTQWLRTEADRAAAVFDSRVRAAGIPAEWRAVEGGLVATATVHARYADLAVVGQGLDASELGPEASLLPDELVMTVGRPVLMVPTYGTFPTIGERVLIGWNGGREATRAVNDAIPLLARARKVTVLAVDPPVGSTPRLPGADIALHLARHGITVEAAQTQATDIDVGDVLLSYAADIGADLIVTGAYGHSRVREVILGGVTRHLLRHMTVPVLMSH